MCRRDEWTFTVHLTRHHDSGALTWCAAVTDGPAFVGDVEIGESANLLDFSVECASYLALTHLIWMRSEERQSSGPMEPTVSQAGSS